LHLVAVEASAEADEAEDSGGEREYEAVARELAQVLENVREGPGHIRSNVQGDRLDVAALAARGGGRELDGAGCGDPCFGQGTAELERPRAGRMGESEVGIGRDRPPQRVLGADIGGEQLLHGQHVLLARDRRFGREGKIPEILGHNGVRAPGSAPQQFMYPELTRDLTVPSLSKTWRGSPARSLP
jgi:hypothetical protein